MRVYRVVAYVRKLPPLDTPHAASPSLQMRFDVQAQDFAAAKQEAEVVLLDWLCGMQPERYEHTVESIYPTVFPLYIKEDVR